MSDDKPVDRRRFFREALGDLLRPVARAIEPAKDVDGLHPTNAGLLLQGVRTLVPCTPLGVLEILRRYAIPLEGAEAVVIGRSDIVGKPMSVLLQQAQNIQALAISPWLLCASVPVIIVILALNFMGDGLRDAADPYGH